MPATTTNILQLAHGDAFEYLCRQIALLQAERLRVFGEVLRGEPSEIIVKTARHVVPNLIVLGIHDEEGPAVFLSKSAVSMIAGSAHLPLLLVRKSRGNALKTDSSLERPWFVVPHAFSGDRSLGP